MVTLLEKYRKICGLSKYIVQKETGITAASILDYERKLTAPSLKAFYIIYNYLNGKLKDKKEKLDLEKFMLDFINNKSIENKRKKQCQKDL